jgi:hypothetical protein
MHGENVAHGLALQPIMHQTGCRAMCVTWSTLWHMQMTSGRLRLACIGCTLAIMVGHAVEEGR